MNCDELRDDQWERLKDLVPGGRKGKRGPRANNRRFLTALIAGICSCLFIASTGFAADLSPLIAKAREEKELVWYTTTSAGDNQAIITGFTRKYPFLKTQALRTTGEKLRQRVLTETAAGQFFSDVVSVSGLEMGVMKSKNLLQPYVPPEAENYPAGAKDRDGYYTAIYARNFVIGYNTAMIPEKDRPKDWPDLVEPRWKGKFGIDEEEFEWYGTIIDYWGREKAIKYMKALAAQQPQLRRGHSLLGERLDERLHHVGLELRAAKRAKQRDGFLRPECDPVRPVARQRVVRVGDSHDASCEGDVGARAEPRPADTSALPYARRATARIP